MDGAAEDLTVGWAGAIHEPDGGCEVNGHSNSQMSSFQIFLQSFYPLSKMTHHSDDLHLV
jgi:hypothetical protein